MQSAPPPVVLYTGLGLLAFIACFVYAIFRASADHEQQRAVLLKTFCDRHFTFVFEVDKSYDLQAKIRSFGGIGTARNRVKQVALCTVPLGRFFLFDQMKISSASRGGFYTICLAEQDHPFTVPDLVITEVDNRLAARISRALPGRERLVPVLTGDSAFDNRFVVFAADPVQAAKALCPSARRVLDTQAGVIRARIVVQVQGRRLVVHNSGQGLRTLDSVEELAALFRLTNQLARQWSVFPASLLPKQQPSSLPQPPSPTQT